MCSIWWLVGVRQWAVSGMQWAVGVCSGHLVVCSEQWPGIRQLTV